MAVRSFGGSDSLELLPGSLVGSTIDAFTIAVLFKRNQTAFSPLLEIGPATSANVYGNGSSNFDSSKLRPHVTANANNQLTLGNYSTSDRTSTQTVVNADGWCIAVWTKAAGTASVDVHVRKLTAATTSRQTMAGGNLTASAAVLSTNRWQLGKDEFANRFNGSIALAGFWTIGMTNAQVDALWANLWTRDWYAHAAGAPFHLWQFDQSGTVVAAIADLMGNGADQTAVTGTTVVTGDDPPGWNFGILPNSATGFGDGSFGDGTFGVRATSGTTISLSGQGVASAEEWGATTAAPQPVTITLAGLASTEAWGATTVAAELAPAGVASAEAWGAATVDRGPVTVAPSGIAPAEAWGATTVAAGPVIISPAGVASLEQWGAATVAAGAVSVAPTGLSTAEAWGAAIFAAGPVTVTPAGIATTEAWGATTLAAQPVTVAPAGIATTEGWGSTALEYVAALAGVPSAEQWGSMTVGAPYVAYATDQFNRSIALDSGLGTADLGGAWSFFGQGTWAGFGVDGTLGRGYVRFTAANTDRKAILAGVSQLDGELTAKVVVPAVPVGGNAVLRVWQRKNASNDYYRASIFFLPAGTIDASLDVVAADTTATVPSGGAQAATGLSYTAGQVVRVKFQATGASPTTIRVRAWLDGTSEPSTWNRTATDSTTGLQAAGAPGLHLRVGSGLTASVGAPFDIQVDDFILSAPTAFDQYVAPASLTSLEAWGSTTVTPQAVTASPAGIPSSEAWGAAVVAPQAVSAAPAGVPSAEAWGSAVVAAGPTTVAAAGIASGEAWGSTSVAPGAATVALTGAASAEGWGASLVGAGAATIAAAGIATSEQWGLAAAAAGPVSVAPASVSSSEAWGSTAVTAGAINAALTGIPTGEAWGATAITYVVAATGVPSGEAWGSTTITAGAVAVAATGVTSSEAWGVARIRFSAYLRPNGDLTLTGWTVVPSGTAWAALDDEAVMA